MAIPNFMIIQYLFLKYLFTELIAHEKFLFPVCQAFHPCDFRFCIYVTKTPSYPGPYITLLPPLLPWVLHPPPLPPPSLWHCETSNLLR
jgi:hypothetical protein